MTYNLPDGRMTTSRKDVVKRGEKISCWCQMEYTHKKAEILQKIAASSSNKGATRGPWRGPALQTVDNINRPGFVTKYVTICNQSPGGGGNNLTPASSYQQNSVETA